MTSTNTNRSSPPDPKPTCVPYTSSRIAIGRPTKMDIDAITNGDDTAAAAAAAAARPSHSPKNVSPIKPDPASGDADARTTESSLSAETASLQSQRQNKDQEQQQQRTTKRLASPPANVASATRNPEPPLTPPSKRASLSLKRSSAQFLSPNKNRRSSTQLLSPEANKLSSAHFVSPSYNQAASQYNLPNSPGVLSNKRTSAGVFKYSNFPQTPDRFARSNALDELTSPAGLASPNYASTDEILKSSEKLQEISSNLKTRLSYAFSKVHGSQADDDNPESKDAGKNESRPLKRRSQSNLLPRHKHQSLPANLSLSSNFLNQLLEQSSSKSPPKQNQQQSGPGLMEPFNTTPSRKVTTPSRPRGIYIPHSQSTPSYNFEEEDHILSANDAFLAAISRSSPKKIQQQQQQHHHHNNNHHHHQQQQHRNSQQQPGNVQQRYSVPNFSRQANSSLSHQRSLTFSPIKTDLKPPMPDADDKSKEQEAIQSLLSLSSPVSKKSAHKPWHPLSSPTPNKQSVNNLRGIDQRNRMERRGLVRQGDTSSTEEEIDEEMPSSPVKNNSKGSTDCSKSRSSTPLSQMKGTAAAL